MDQAGAIIESELPDLSHLALEDVPACRRGREWQRAERRLLTESGNPAVFAGDPKSSFTV
ncbi:hypothetical protein [Streptomyces alanosinicus]|uniref:Uncharacterized protein n=1 Tax=Streptomyces alanosinicus TaxID=68171 RepID=A0A919D1L1_9ACTN|nr:hypothetical protein [Streptomyces alanosinicus]GHE01179.1 hypothetical protein GCM10010339_19350 [Streptomyces alanosinicus]